MKRTKYNRWGLLLLLIPAFLFTACDDDDDNDVVVDVMTPTEFLQEAAAIDTFEIVTANLALENSTQQEVREFAQLMLQEHTMTRAQLRTEARERGISLQMNMSQERETIRARLQNQTGTPFDKDFANVQVQAHEDAILFYEQARDQLRDQDLKTLADQILLRLRDHLQDAQQLKTFTDEL
ncbi:DUF4142 domain-containing protein [Pontibacter populi]|uniref:DUF4142 domain-containing protein n=1 Tax=Pontibacter populi TaxID=890055 RepID=A0ABV1RY06_9BACT